MDLVHHVGAPICSERRAACSPITTKPYSVLVASGFITRSPHQRLIGPLVMDAVGFIYSMKMPQPGADRGTESTAVVCRMPQVPGSGQPRKGSGDLSTRDGSASSCHNEQSLWPS